MTDRKAEDAVESRNKRQRNYASYVRRRTEKRGGLEEGRMQVWIDRAIEVANGFEGAHSVSNEMSMSIKRQSHAPFAHSGEPL